MRYLSSRPTNAEQTETVRMERTIGGGGGGPQVASRLLLLLFTGEWFGLCPIRG